MIAAQKNTDMVISMVQKRVQGKQKKEFENQSIFLEHFKPVFSGANRAFALAYVVSHVQRLPRNETKK